MYKLALLVLVGFGGLLQATTVHYQFLVDTSGYSGNAGTLNFQLNPAAAPPTDAALATVYGFSGGTLGAGTPTGDVTGDLTSNLFLANTFSLNDWTQLIAFGNTILFTVDITGPLLDSPTGFDGATFSLQITPDNALPASVFTAVQLDLFPGNDPQILTLDSTVTAVPEPGTAWTLLLALPLGVYLRRKKA